MPSLVIDTREQFFFGTGDGSAGYYAEPPAPRRKSMSLAQGPDLNRLSLALKLSARSSLATSMAGLGSWSGRKSDGLNWRPKHSSGRRWHRVGGRPAGGLFLAALVILPHCATRQESFVLLCQVAQGAEQLPRLQLEARQLPQTCKDKFGWPFHNLI